MDEAAVREAAETHARATVERDYATAGSYLGDEAKANVGEIMREMPRSLRSGEVQSVEPAGDGYTCRIRYEGEASDVTIESRWEDVEGAPKIVGLEVVDRA